MELRVSPDFKGTICLKQTEILGDANSDQRLELKDFAHFSSDFQNIAPAQRWTHWETAKSQRMDMNQDGRLDILDLSGLPHTYLQTLDAGFLV